MKNNLLIINGGPGLGDAIQCIIYIFHLKYIYNLKIYFYSFHHENNNYFNFYNKISKNIFINLNNFNEINNFENVILLFNSRTNEIFAGKDALKELFHKINFKNFKDIKEYEKPINSLIADDDNLFQRIHKHMKNIFYDKIDKFNVKNNIVISISTNTARNKGLTDLKFQDIICNIIINNKDKKFCIIGKNEHVLSKNLRKYLEKRKSNILNLLDKDEGLIDVINILYHSKIFISRCSGLAHLSGLLNIQILELKNYTRGIHIYFKKDSISYKCKNEYEHPFYKENWVPITNKLTRIIEFKKYDYLYNNYNYVYYYIDKYLNEV